MLIGVVAVAWWVAPWHGASPITVTGRAGANADLTAIAFDPDSRWDALRYGLSDGGEGFSVAGVNWAGPDNVWSDEMPVACLRTGEMTRVELSFVEVRHDADSLGGPTRVVTSLRCLE